MGEGYLLLVPTDPYYHPAEPACERATNALKALVGCVWVDVWDKPEVTFFGEPDAVERVACPLCFEDLSVAWWRAAMEEAYRADMLWPTLEITLPCCGRASRLDGLKYQPECLFGGFALFVGEGTLCGPLTAEQLAQVEAAIGCPLRQTWRVDT